MFKIELDDSEINEIIGTLLDAQRCGINSVSDILDKLIVIRDEADTRIREYEVVVNARFETLELDEKRVRDYGTQYIGTHISILHVLTTRVVMDNWTHDIPTSLVSFTELGIG